MYIFLSLSLSPPLSLSCFNVFSFGLGRVRFKLAVTWPAYLFGFFVAVQCQFQEVTYCRVYLFILLFVDVKFLFQVQVINFRIKSNSPICFQIFCSHLLFFSFNYWFFVDIFQNNFYASLLKSWLFVWKCSSTNIRLFWSIDLILFWSINLILCL